jgi:hypothetical protein
MLSVPASPETSPVEIPDLRHPETRRALATDDWFPDLPDP